MPINDRNLKPGVKLVGRYHKQTYICEVIEVEGKLRFRLGDGRVFKSPSAAGMAITGKSCNGWAFWSVQKDEAALAATAQTETTQEQPPAPEAAEATAAPAEEQSQEIATEPDTAATAAPAEAVGPAKKRIFRLPNQKGSPEGHPCGY